MKKTLLCSAIVMGITLVLASCETIPLDVTKVPISALNDKSTVKVNSLSYNSTSFLVGRTTYTWDDRDGNPEKIVQLGVTIHTTAPLDVDLKKDFLLIYGNGKENESSACSLYRSLAESLFGIVEKTSKTYTINGDAVYVLVFPYAPKSNGIPIGIVWKGETFIPLLEADNPILTEYLGSNTKDN